MKIFSFSLWGEDKIYTEGCIKNVALIRKYLPDWHTYIFASESVDKTILNRLLNFYNVHLIKCPHIEPTDSKGMFWRFAPISNKKFEYIAIRDTDSRISPREIYAMLEWIDSKTDVHIMRDHPYHSSPIMGGMWGIRGGLIKDLNKKLDYFKPTSEKGQDQYFLNTLVYKSIKNKDLTATVHDPFFEKINFPKQSRRGQLNAGVDFVGQCFLETGVPNSSEDISVLYKTFKNDI
jgi:hypothetical protein